MIKRFKPKIVKKHQSNIFGIEDRIISLYGCGMSTRSIPDNIRKLYGFDFLGIRRLEKKWTTKVQDWGTTHSQLTILFAEKKPETGKAA
ncbi:MAG: transposase [Holosporaceae bacterium]|nr:transposase [Holosporaceae bacterium]